MIAYKPIKYAITPAIQQEKNKRHPKYFRYL